MLEPPRRRHELEILGSATAEAGGRDADDDMLIGADIVAERIYFPHGCFLFNIADLSPLNRTECWEKIRLPSVRPSAVIFAQALRGEIKMATC